jgi:hypothetical protein
MAGREDTAPAMGSPMSAAPIAAAQRWRPATALARPDPHEADWAGTGFSHPGPTEHSAPRRELIRAALRDALAFTADRDGCGDCDGARLCETHTRRAARAEQYKQALEQEMKAGP